MRVALPGLGLALASIIAVAALGTSCHGTCKVQSDCASGQLCDFTTGDCLEGCKRDGDCGEGRCDTRYGVCHARSVTYPDAAGSSTTAPDASAADASTASDAAAGD